MLQASQAQVELAKINPVSSGPHNVMKVYPEEPVNSSLKQKECFS
jgi:hypothetical protein